MRTGHLERVKLKDIAVAVVYRQSYHSLKGLVQRSQGEALIEPAQSKIRHFDTDGESEKRPTKFTLRDHVLPGDTTSSSLDAVRTLRTQRKVRDPNRYHTALPRLGFDRMHCHLGVIATPTLDTPGSLFYLHFDDRRYLIGNLSEGSTRAITQANVSLRKVSDVFLTGRTRWSNIGGILGLVLGLADTKASAVEAIKANARGKNGDDRATQAIKDRGASQINIYGAPNLNHAIATSRRFIFRRGLPITATEYPSTSKIDPPPKSFEPSFIDDRVMVWAFSASPPSAADSESPRSPPTSGKRSFDEANGIPVTKETENDELRRHVVREMFNSNWRYDRLTEMKLSEICMPATCYLRDPDSKQLVVYQGPKPGQGQAVPDINVLVREPWPGSQVTRLPPTKAASESLSYVISNHAQRGQFLPRKAQEFEVPKGSLWSQLSSGESVENIRGETITPDMVLQPGRPGSAFAVIDLASVEYIQPLMDRPEWNAPEVTTGLVTMIWLLGPGVGRDPRVKQFQERFQQLEHHVSSVDYSEEDAIALDGAAKNSLKHSCVDHEIFPTLQTSSTESDDTSTHTAQLSKHLPLSRALARGQSLSLEPKFSSDERFVSPPLDVTSVVNKMREELSKYPEVASRVDVRPTPEESSSWAEAMGAHADVEVIVLGTGSSHPSKYRNVSGTLVRVPGWGSLLLDCGEGSLNTMRRMFPQDQLDEILLDLRMIWISHLHADHHLGTTSMIKAWNRVRMKHANPSAGGSGDENTFWGELDPQDRPKVKLAIVSDKPMSSWLHEYGSVEDMSPKHLLTLATRPPHPQMQAGYSRNSAQSTNISLVDNTTEVSDIGTKAVLETLNVASLDTVYVNHCHGAQAVSITFKNGFKLSYSGDCRPSATFPKIGKDSHVLIHEATFEDDMRLEAIAKQHSTAGEALIVAAEMKAKVCILTHFSQRYPTMPPLGVDIANKADQPRLDVDSILESTEQKQLSAGVEAGEDQEEDTANGVNGEASRSDEASSKRRRSTLERESKREEMLRKRGASINDAQLIDQDDVQKLIDQTGLKVVFAFDYMRLKLSNVPRLLKKQPILRAMYDLEIGKKLIDAEEEEGKVETKNAESAKQRKKRERRERLEEESKEAQAKKRSKSQVDVESTLNEAG